MSSGPKETGRRARAGRRTRLAVSALLAGLALAPAPSSQQGEVTIAVAALNRMIQVTKPVSIRIA